MVKTLAETLGISFYLISGITVTHNSPVLQTVFISFLSYTVTLHPDVRYDQGRREACFLLVGLSSYFARAYLGDNSGDIVPRKILKFGASEITGNAFISINHEKFC